MSGLREAREAEARKWLVGHYAALRDGPGIPPAVVSDLADFAAQAAEAEPRPPSDAEIGAWIEAHPREVEAWERRQNRINGAPPPFDAPAPQPRRRTARKAGGT